MNSITMHMSFQTHTVHSSLAQPRAVRLFNIFCAFWSMSKAVVLFHCAVVLTGYSMLHNVCFALGPKYVVVSSDETQQGEASVHDLGSYDIPICATTESIGTIRSNCICSNIENFFNANGLGIRGQICPHPFFFIQLPSQILFLINRLFVGFSFTNFQNEYLKKILQCVLQYVPEKN